MKLRHERYVVGLVALLAMIAPQTRATTASREALGEVLVDVSHQRADGTAWLPARVGMELHPGDFVRTGPKGVAMIVYLDGSRFSIKPSSLVQVHSGGARLTASAPVVPPSRPPEVPSDRWVALGPKIGIVIEDPSKAQGSIAGSLMIEVAGTWLPVALRLRSTPERSYRRSNRRPA